MTGMTAIEVQRHIKECRQKLTDADDCFIGDNAAAYAVGALIIAIEQLAEVVEDLSNREQDKAIQ